MACRHPVWDAETLPDHEGMVTERCRSCGVERKTIGTWWALKTGGKISANAMFDGSSVFSASDPPSYHLNNVDIILTAPKRENVMPKKREPRPHGFWKDHQGEVIKDIETLGPDAARKKWRVPETTWKTYLPGWLAIMNIPPIPAITDEDPLKELMRLIAGGSKPESIRSRGLEIKQDLTQRILRFQKTMKLIESLEDYYQDGHDENKG